MGEGPWDLKNDTVVSLLGLLFNLMCIRHGNEKTGNKKCQTIRENQRPTKSLLSPSKGPEKEHLSMTDVLENTK